MDYRRPNGRLSLDPGKETDQEAVVRVSFRFTTINGKKTQILGFLQSGEIKRLC